MWIEFNWLRTEWNCG